MRRFGRSRRNVSDVESCRMLAERAAMISETRLDDLIERGWLVLYRDVDRRAFRNWQCQSLACLETLFGPEHPYVQAFKSHVQNPEELSVLIGGGILTAAKEEIKKKH